MKEVFKKPENNVEIIKPTFSKTVSEEEAINLAEKFYDHLHARSSTEGREWVKKQLDEIKEKDEHLRFGPWNFEWDGNKVFIHNCNPDDIETSKLMNKIIKGESE